LDTRASIIEKQRQWALNRGIELVGSEWDRGLRAYTPTLEENLFEPLSDLARAESQDGDGGEINRSKKGPPKMQALHSSSALGVNIFHYWNRPDRVNEIAAACGFCKRGSTRSERLAFEMKFKIAGHLTRRANIDVVLVNNNSARTKVFAVECKFTEAYRTGGHPGLRERYLKLDRPWDGLTNLRKIAEEVREEDKTYHHLHPAQLIKHVLGLRKAYDDRFRLLYLWYDAPLVRRAGQGWQPAPMGGR